MSLDVQETRSEGVELQHYLAIARRRHLQFLIPLFIGWLTIWSASWILPVSYKSGTLILVEQPTMPRDYVVPNVTDNLQERLQSITEQILSRTRLLTIIDDLNLYADGRIHRAEDEKVERMRKDIEIELVRDGRDQVRAFKVYYASKDPHVAQAVTGRLTNLFISENLEVRQQQSEATTKFLESQLETARQNLSRQEQEIREFKGQHIVELPAQLQSNLQILQGLQSQLQSEADAINTAKQQRVYLETLIDQYHSLEGAAKPGEATSIGLPAVDRELDKLRSQLADLTAHYTDRHPDVKKTKEQIVETEKMRAQLMADLKAAGTNIQNEDPTSANQAAYAKEPSPVRQLKGQLQANQVEIKNREQIVAGLEAKISDYQSRLNQEPVREQQLADLTRGYDQSKANYDELLKKKNESAMATRMELLQQGERFRVLDPPSLPVKPEFPNRLKFCGIGLGVGLALGIVVAGAFEMMDDRVYSDGELTQLLPIAVICEIPTIVIPDDQSLLRRRIWFGWAATVVVVGGILAGSAFSFLRG